MIKISASVVLYHTPKYQLENLFKSIFASQIDMLYVIDNSPNIKLLNLDVYSDKIKYIPNNNIGYGASHNIALRLAIESNSEYHVVLNPDISFNEQVISNLIDYAENHLEVVYMLPRVIDPDGTVQYLCKLLPTPIGLFLRRFIPTSKFSRIIDKKYTLRNSGYNKIINPPCLSGCFMFLRVSVLKENKIFFDDRFFMYFEDFDLIRRLHRHGKTLYYPEVTIVHEHAKESYKNPKMLLYHLKSAFKYFNKYGWFYDKERRIMNKKVIREIDELQSLLYPSQKS